MEVNGGSTASYLARTPCVPVCFSLFQQVWKQRGFFWCAGTTQILEKNAPRMLGQMKIFHVGSHQFRELLRELWFSYCSSRGMPFREWNFIFREWNFEFRELLREYPGTLRELREWPFHSESFFPEIGVVPRLLTFRLPSTTWDHFRCTVEPSSCHIRGRYFYFLVCLVLWLARAVTTRRNFL